MDILATKCHPHHNGKIPTWLSLLDTFINKDYRDLGTLTQMPVVMDTLINKYRPALNGKIPTRVNNYEKIHLQTPARLCWPSPWRPSRPLWTGFRPSLGRCRTLSAFVSGTVAPESTSTPAESSPFPWNSRTVSVTTPAVPYEGRGGVCPVLL